MGTRETPAAFFWRRLHSFMGLVLVVFIIEHLLTNSQAALLIGDDGRGFIHGVNWIHNLPYLPVIEVLILVVPFTVHGLWGIRYLWTAKSNSFPTDGSKPALPEYPRNQCYTWQRITSWILLVGVLLHVAHMRFAEYPVSTQIGMERSYMVDITKDPGLYTVAERLGVTLYDRQSVRREQMAFDRLRPISHPKTPPELIRQQDFQQEKEWIEALESTPLESNELLAVTPDFGTAELLVVRNAFKNPWMIGLYTGLVIATVFHAFNGLWTFLITWGITLTERSQTYMKYLSVILMLVVGALGLSAIWLTYWVNLRY